MSSCKTQAEIAATGIAFEGIRVDYWRQHNRHDLALEAERERQSWELKFQTAQLIAAGELEGQQ